MSTDETSFLNTVLNGSEKDIKQFLIDFGTKGKIISPIYFFDENDREKYIRK